MTDHHPTRDDLQKLIAFMDARVMEEAGRSGAVAFYTQAGFTFTHRNPRITTALRDDAKKVVGGWIEGHTPDQFVTLATALTSMARTTVSLAYAPYEGHGQWQMERAWNEITRTVLRVWPDHPDLLPEWSAPAGE